MDKYTVDLDKVLNDFEYSELTDQYNTSKEKCNESNYSTDLASIQVKSHINDTSSSFKNSHVKHSINNVFQSLNEYLSTDIRTTADQNESDKENINEKSTIEHNKLVPDLREKDLKNNSDTFKTESSNDTKNKMDLKDFVNNDLNIQKPVLKTEIDNTINDCKNVNIKDNFQKLSKNVNINANWGNQTENLFDIAHQNVDSNYFYNDVNTTGDLSRNISLDVQDRQVKETQVSSQISKDSNLLVVSSNRDVRDNVNKDANLSHQTVSEEDKTLQVVDNTASDNKVIENKTDLVREVNESEISRREKNMVIEEQDDLEIENEADKEQNESQNENNKVGFKPLDIDDSELEEYLQEIEDEYETPKEEFADVPEEKSEMQEKLTTEHIDIVTSEHDQVNKIPENIKTIREEDEADKISISDENTCEEDKNKEEVEQVIVKENVNQNLSNLEDVTESAKIEGEHTETSKKIIEETETSNQDIQKDEILKETVETVEPLETIKKTQHKIVEHNKDSREREEILEIICQVKEHEENTDDKKRVDKEIKESKNVPEESRESKQDEIQNPEVTLTEESDSKQEKCVEEQKIKDTPRRPSILEVKSVIEQEPAEVNVTGKPGSTPYNNAYQYKTFDANEEVTTESDTESSSSSPSPTFSDISTVSSATTATIDSCNNSIDQNINANEKTKDNPNDRKEDAKVTSGEESQTGGKLESGEGDDNSSRQDVAETCESNIEESNVEGNSNENSKLENVNSDPENSTERTCNTGSSSNVNVSESSGDNVNNPHSSNSGSLTTEQPYRGYGPDTWLGKQAPLWIPDSETMNCLHCDMKFTIIKRRHHCRACGLVLCSKCCNLQYRLEYLDAEARVCNKCYEILSKENSSSSESEVSPMSGNSPNYQGSQPNPNNPMEYCSMVPPLQQVSSSSQSPPTVMVPVGVLKRKGSGKARKNKSVMFCDGIRPGSELTNLDNDFNYSNSKTTSHKMLTSPSPPKLNRNMPEMDSVTKSFIPSSENDLPPSVTIFKSDITYKEQTNDENLVKLLKEEMVTFALQRNLHVHVQLIDMQCCINKLAWCFSTEGLITVGQDEIVILLEYVEGEKVVPKDIFIHLNNVYLDAKKGTSISELGISLHQSVFLGSKNHAGFLYIRPTHQCLKNIIIPKEPYLIGILVHRWEIPWAKIFPLRLVLRLGAEYRYYPSPIISTRQRESVFVEIGHTIINLLADFRNFSYTLPNIRGLVIHMEGKTTTVSIPSNRYDQVMKSINNSSEHILAFGGNFSVKADSHLVCIQDTQGKNENTYATHTISIQNRPREVTGVSFIVFNGNLKSTSGLTAKSSVVEDGLMIQIPSEQMEKLRESLRNMKDYSICCGCINTPSDEMVKIVWAENDVNFNVGIDWLLCSSLVLSPIDNESLSGVPSIRVHNGKDYVCNSGNRMIRWTEVFILQNGDENSKGQEIDYSKISESISKASCQALVKYLDLLSSNNFYKIGIRTNLHLDNVSYSAGSNGIKLPPIYMKSLDNELIPVLHRITSNNWGESTVVLELIFRVLNV